jgi:hypothetical protein
MNLEGVQLFFIHLIVNYYVYHPSFHVLISIFLKKHLILIEKGDQNNSKCPARKDFAQNL